MQRHSNEKPYACSFCDYRATDKNLLNKHTLRHTRNRPHACDICSYRATKKSDLKAHMRVHTGERPHACPLCDYRAAHKSTLTAHLRRHTGEKPHACDQCDYRSTTKSDLTKHMRVHLRLAPTDRTNKPLNRGPRRSKVADDPTDKSAACSRNPAVKESPMASKLAKNTIAKRRGVPTPMLADRLHPFYDESLGSRSCGTRSRTSSRSSSRGLRTPVTTPSSATTSECSPGRRTISPQFYGLAL